jgi:hypothetical protein
MPKIALFKITRSESERSSSWELHHLDQHTEWTDVSQEDFEVLKECGGFSERRGDEYVIIEQIHPVAIDSFIENARIQKEKNEEWRKSQERIKAEDEERMNKKKLKEMEDEIIKLKSKVHQTHQNKI